MISGEGRQYLAKVSAILNHHEVDYIVVGGAAVSHYGYNRPSGAGHVDENIKADLDFWYNPTVENFQRILTALTELGVDTSDLEKVVFDKTRTFLKIPHGLYQTDFLPVMEGLGSFRNSKLKAERTNVEGVNVDILCYEDLIANKKAVNRKIDQSDIAELNKLSQKKKKRRRM